MPWHWADKNNNGRRKYTPEIVAELREMKKTRTFKQLEAETGIAWQTLNRLFNEM